MRNTRYYTFFLKVSQLVNYYVLLPVQKVDKRYKGTAVNVWTLNACVARDRGCTRYSLQELHDGDGGVWRPRTMACGHHAGGNPSATGWHQHAFMTNLNAWRPRTRGT